MEVIIMRDGRPVKLSELSYSEAMTAIKRLTDLAVILTRKLRGKL
jgi:hypothetical protein